MKTSTDLDAKITLVNIAALRDKIPRCMSIEAVADN